MSNWEYNEIELWRQGQEGITLFHVFGLVALEKNTVLAFAEAREKNGRDADCPHSIWLRRSEDGGKTFEPSVRLCFGEVGRCLTDPTPVYDEETKRLFLFYTENYSDKQTRNYMVISDDKGKSWSKERDMSQFFINEDRMQVNVPGPGHGICLKGGAHSGRLVVPFWHRKYGGEKVPEEREYCLSTLYSDDHGETWQQSEYVGQGCMGNESCIGETQEGLIRSIRGGGVDPCRYVSFSYDGGTVWTKETPMAVGAANTCQAGLLCLRGKKGYENVVLISRVGRLESRRDMEILISLNGGICFPYRMQLPPGEAFPGYSDMCVIEEEEPLIGLLHCRNNYVLFSRISMQTLTGGNYEKIECSKSLEEMRNGVSM